MKRNRTYTIFDVMEDKGVFDSNAANLGAYDRKTGESLYVGPVEYPKMLYHPKGEMEVTNPGQALTDANGIAILDRGGEPIVRGRQEAIITVLVNSREEEDRLVAEGWHDKPWKANKAAGRKFTPVQTVDTPLSSAQKDEYIKELERRYAALLDSTKPTEQLLAEQERPISAASSGTSVVPPPPPSPIEADLVASGLLETDE